MYTHMYVCMYTYIYIYIYIYMKNKQTTGDTAELRRARHRRVRVSAGGSAPACVHPVSITRFPMKFRKSTV